MASAPKNTIGRTASAGTVNRQVRRSLNHYAGALAEKSLAKALAGDPMAMLATAILLQMANRQDAKTE